MGGSPRPLRLFRFAVRLSMFRVSLSIRRSARLVASPTETLIMTADEDSSAIANPKIAISAPATSPKRPPENRISAAPPPMTTPHKR